MCDNYQNNGVTKCYFNHLDGKKKTKNKPDCHKLPTTAWDFNANISRWQCNLKRQAIFDSWKYVRACRHEKQNRGGGQKEWRLSSMPVVSSDVMAL